MKFLEDCFQLIVFNTDPDEMWKCAIEGLGVDPLRLTPAPGLQ